MNFKLELSEQMMGVIGEALGNAPFRTSAPIIAEIQRQVDAQRQQSPAPNIPPDSQTLKSNGGGVAATK